MDYETLNLRRYITLFINQKHLILAATFLGMIIAFLLTSIQSPVYKAEATIAVLRSRTEVEFDSRIRTLSDYELANPGISARQDALVALVSGNEVIQMILDDAGEYLDPESRNINDLRNMVETETVGDLININIQHEDPNVAAQIANSWATNYAQYVNSIYSTSPVVRSNSADQVAVAEQRYNEAQKALEEFTAEEQVLALQREIASRQTLLQSYQQALDRIQASPTDTSQALLLDYYRELQQIENWLVAANSLREQVNRDSGSPAAELGNTVALLMLRSRIFGGEGGSTATDGVVTSEGTGTGSASGSVDARPGTDLVLQLDLGNAPEDGITTGDVDAVIEVLEQRREDARARIADLVETINSGTVALQASPAESPLLTQISTLDSEIAALQSELEAQTARRRELEQARDRTWDTYQVLVGRQVEQEIVSESPSAEVRIADTAIVPTEPASRGLIRNTILAGLAALILSVGAIIAWEWWKSGEAYFAEPGISEVPPDATESGDPGCADAPPPAPEHTGQLSDSVT